jgi:hypothetical protein
MVHMEGTVYQTTKIWAQLANYACINYNNSNWRLTGTCSNDQLYMYDGNANYYTGGKIGNRMQLSGKIGSYTFWK